MSLFNIALHFGQHEPVWLEILKYFIMPLVSVFIGAVLAYKYNLNLEIIKKRDEQIEKFAIIYNKANIIFDELIRYKRFLIEKLKPIYEYNSIKAACEPIYIPKIKFAEPLDEYIMLSFYNTSFPIILSNVNKNVEILLTLLKMQKEYREKCHKLLQNVNNLSLETINNFKKDFEELIEDIDKTICWVYILNDKLCKCNAKYFNNLRKDVSDELILSDTEKHYLPNLLDDKYYNEKYHFENFEKYWLKPNTMWEDLALFCRKVKYKFMFLVYYFTLDKIVKPKGKK